MYSPAVQPPEMMESFYGPRPRKRAVNVLDMVSVAIGDLFPDIQGRIYGGGEDVSVIEKATGMRFQRSIWR